MGIFDLLSRDGAKEARQTILQAADGDGGGGALERMVALFRDIGLDGKATFASAARVAERALQDTAGDKEAAVRDVIRHHSRGAAAGGFLTGLGGLVTLPLLLPTNVFEFYVQATRMVGAIATIRGYDVADDEVRARVLASLVGEESGDVLDHVGLGPIAGAATKQVVKRLPAPKMSELTKAIGVRLLRRFGLRSFRLFGKAIPGLGGVIGAWSDHRQLAKVARAAERTFPPAAPRGR